MSEELKNLKNLPKGVGEAETLIRDFDSCFSLGFSRLGKKQTKALGALQRTFLGTPLEASVTESVEGISRSEFREPYFSALAAARAALRGAQYDALDYLLVQTFGRKRVQFQPGEKSEPSDSVGVWMESTRQWLTELALGGFMQLEAETLMPFMATLEQLQQTPSTTRLAMMLTGFLNEMLDCLPISGMNSLPLCRWVDLWSKAMVGANSLPDVLPAEKVTGVLSILGVDLHHHPNGASFVAYGILENSDGFRFVRTTQSAYKVDVVVGSEFWKLFENTAPGPLLQAIAGQKKLLISKTTLLSTGDLVLDGTIKLSSAVNIFNLASDYFSGPNDDILMPCVAPLDRHPIQLAEPVYFENFKILKGERPKILVGDREFSIATERLSSCSALKIASITGAKKMFGLLRFDGGLWEFQPLVVTKGKKPISNGSEAVSKKKSNTVATLKERAGKLLRR